MSYTDKTEQSLLWVVQGLGPCCLNEEAGTFLSKDKRFMPLNAALFPLFKDRNYNPSKLKINRKRKEDTNVS